MIRRNQDSQSKQLCYVFDKMGCEIRNWRKFAEALGVAFLIRDLEVEEKYKEVHEKIAKCIAEKIERSKEQLDNNWNYWRNILLQIGEGDLVDDIEYEHPTLYQEDSNNIVHKLHNDFGILAHAVKPVHFQKLLEPLKEEIEICVGAGTTNSYAVKELRDIPTIQDKYFSLYQGLELIKIHDHSSMRKTKQCQILQTMYTWLQENQDDGFCIRGYNVKQHFQRFCYGYDNRIPYKDSYVLTYSDIHNVIFYIDTAPLDIRQSMKDNLLNIRYLYSSNQCLTGYPFVYIPITLYDLDNPEVAEMFKQIKCKTCNDLKLVVSSETFKDHKLFKIWWKKIRPEVEQIIARLSAKSDKKMQLIASAKAAKKMQSIAFLKSIIGFMAITEYDLPNHADLPREQIYEAHKLIMLSPEQKDIIFSHKKRKIIKGSFGSGKTITAHEIIKFIERDLSDFELIYYLIHDTKSAYVDQMKRHVETMKNNNKVRVFKISELVGEKKSLSSIFQHLVEVAETETIHTFHVFVEEFNGEVLDEEEVAKIKVVLENEIFKNSQIVIVCQSMESDRYRIKDESRINYNKYQFDKLSERAGFKIFNLSYLLRSSQHINDIVSAAISILHQAEMISVLPIRENATSNDKEHTNLQLTSGYEGLPNNKQTLSHKEATRVQLNKEIRSEDNLDEHTLVQEEPSVNTDDTDKLLKQLTLNANNYKSQTKLISQYKFIGDRVTAQSVKGTKPTVYYPFNPRRKSLPFKMIQTMKKLFRMESQRFNDIEQIYCLSKVLEKIKSVNKENDKPVIICMNKDSIALIKAALEVNGTKWTDNPQLLHNEEYELLLTDYSSVRGCEFLNVIFIIPIDEMHLKHNLIDGLSRCILCLYIIVLNIGIPDALLVEILNAWERLNLVDIDAENYLKKLSQDDELIKFNKINANMLIKDNQNQTVDINDAEIINSLFNISQFASNNDEEVKAPASGAVFIASNNDEEVPAEAVESYAVFQDIWKTCKEASRYHNPSLLMEALNRNNLDVNAIYYTYDVKLYIPRSLLHYAAKVNDVDVVKFLCSIDNIDVNITNRFGFTPLMRAAINNNIDVVRVLMNMNNINVNITNVGGYTALEWATDMGHNEIVDLLKYR